MNIVIFDELSDVNEIKTDAREASHILNILKLKEGDEFRAGVWSKSIGCCRIISIDKEKITFSYNVKKEAGKCLPLTIIIGQIRPICMQRLLRFVGMSAIYSLIITPLELSEKNYAKSKLYDMDKCYEFIKEGTSFSKDASKPKLYFANSLSDSVGIAKSLDVKNKILLDDGDGSVKLEKKNDEHSVIAIGSERGFTNKEKKYLTSEGFLRMNIGKRIFRSEESAILSVFPWL